MFSPALAQAQTDWPPQTLISGFPLWHEPADSAPVPAELDEFLKAGPAPVVFTLGSSAVLNPGRFYAESAEAVRQMGVRAVMLDGEGGPGARVDRDVLRLAYAPHSYLFPRASAIIHSGGIGTCAHAMRAGRPMLVVPFAYDQPDNAARLVRLGVARTIGSGSYTAARSARDLQKLVTDPMYQTNADRIARIVNAEDGVGVACDVLENCASV